MKRAKLAASLFVAVLFLTAVGNTMASAVTFSASGADPVAIQATVDSFRTALGSLNPNVAGSFGSGRREINWDGVPDAFSDVELGYLSEAV